MVLVRFHASLDPEALAQERKRLDLPQAQPEGLRSALKAQSGLTTAGQLPQLGVERLRLTEGQTREAVLARLRSSPLVAYAQPNYLRAALTPLNDPQYKSGGQWWLEHIAADRVVADDVLPSGPEVVIAILDSGIFLIHEDLAGRLVDGRDFITPGGNANDTEGHGTHVAGIAAALTNNWLGIAGTASLANVKLMPVKVLQKVGEDLVGDDFKIAQAIIWAVDNNAHVINMSLGGAASSTVLEKAVGYAYARECVVVASGGNEALDEYGRVWNPVIYPAAYDMVVAVAACTSSGARAWYSEYHDYVDIAAPGGEGSDPDGMILSTNNSDVNPYAWSCGTSMAAPMVAGAAAMLLAQDPARTPEEVANLLTTTAEKTGSLATDPDGWNRFLGWGRLNLYRALTREYTYTPKTGGPQTYNYPNPFRPAQGEKTYIVVPVETSGQAAELRIYDSVGRPVRKLSVLGTQIYPGALIAWDGRNEHQDKVANGVYLYVLTVGGQTFKNKIAVKN